MQTSLFDLFKIGIGPSSSHTVGPMVLARRFLLSLSDNEKLNSVESIFIEVYGSLALTGIGHGTDKAILLGLSGEQPHLVDPDKADIMVSEIKDKYELNLFGNKLIGFHPDKDLKFNRRSRLPYHSNGMKFITYGNDKMLLMNISIIPSVAGLSLIKRKLNPRIKLIPSRLTLSRICLIRHERCWKLDKVQG